MSLAGTGKIFAYNTKNKSSPNVFVLFGWTGASYDDVKAKHKLLEQTDVGTIVTVITPPRTILFNDFLMKMTTRKLKNILEDNYCRQKIYILYYSGGGSLYHPLIHEEMAGKISGYIFDSSPVPFKQHIFASWIDSKLGNRLTKFIVGRFSYLLMWPYFNTRMCNPMLLTYNQYVLNTKPNANILLITSKSDLLVPVSHIGDIVKSQSADLLLFDKSGHLEHDNMYPTEYVKKINEFLC